MFEKSLQDLVKGIRSHKRDPSAFISQSIQELKQELKNVDPFIKAQVRASFPSVLSPAPQLTPTPPTTCRRCAS